jgi:hypothetical protein
MITIGLYVAVTATQREAANEVLARSLRLLDRASSVVGVFTQKTPGRTGTATGEFRLKKDAKLAVFSKKNSEICDGIYRTSIDRTKGTYTVKDVRVFELPYIPGFEGFTQWNGKSLVSKFRRDTERDRQPENVRMEMMDGKQVVAYTIGGSDVFIDPVTAMPVGANFLGENRMRTSMKFQNVKIDTSVPDEAFRFRGQEDLEEQATIERGMLRIGQKVPISNVEAMNMLNREMVGKRSTIILFFDDSNAPSGEMLKKMFDISKHRPKDIAVIGVSKTKDWRKMVKGNLNFTVIEDAELPKDSLRAQFGITKYPTLYVIDQHAEATYVQIGMDDSELNPILRGLGLSVP